MSKRGRQQPTSRSETGVDDRKLRAAALIVTTILCTAALAWAQFSFANLHDEDSYFHTRAAQQLREHGVTKELSQAAFSTWKDRYSDKDFLFHVLLIPFCGDEGRIITGGKLAAVFFDFLVLGCLALAFYRLGVRFGPLWMLLLLSTHLHFLLSVVSVRPHVLALALLALELLLLLERRWILLAIVSAAHVWAHASFVLLPMLVLAQAVAHLVKREPLPWKSAGAVLAGIVFASLIHPYFPNNLGLTYDQIFGVARNAWGGGPIPRDLFGQELVSLSLVDFLKVVGASFPVWLPAALGLVVLRWRRSGAPLSINSLTLTFVTAGLLFLALMSPRFFILFFLASAFLAGSVWTELAGAGNHRWSWSRAGAGGWLAIIVLGGCLGLGQLRANVFTLRGHLARSPTAHVYRPAVQFLDGVAGEEDIVYHNFWWGFASLYHFRPDGRYIEGLDPIFLYRFDPRLFGRMLSAYRGEADDPHGVIAGDFGARWIFVSKHPRNRLFRESLPRSPRIVRVYHDAYAEVYRVL